VESRRDGDWLHISVPIYLGEIAAQWVKVELYAHACDGFPDACLPMNAVDKMPGATQGYIFYATVAAERRRITTPHGCARGTRRLSCRRKTR
jgi:starch phosphorylase